MPLLLNVFDANEHGAIFEKNGRLRLQKNSILDDGWVDFRRFGVEIFHLV